MSKAVLLSAVVLAGGIAGYQAYVKPELETTVDSVKPALTAVGEAAQSATQAGHEALEAAKDTTAGRAVVGWWEDRHGFFDPMPSPPAGPQP